MWVPPKVYMAVAAGIALGVVAVGVTLWPVGDPEAGAGPRAPVVLNEGPVAIDGALAPPMNEGEPVTAAPVQAAPPEPQPATATVRVGIKGAVAAPGVYELEADRRVQHLIEAAGGTTPDADLSGINIAAYLIDGATLVVPWTSVAGRQGDRLVMRGGSAAVRNPAAYTRGGMATGAGTSVPRPSAPAGTSGGAVNLNTASAAQLEALPGIGPKRAQKIIAYREQAAFQRVEDLLEIHGIGPKTLAAIKPLVTAP